MESFLKRISFFLIYLPALVFGCQFAYYSGLCEPLKIYIATLGLNYSEVAFLGYLNISVLLLENFNQLMLYLAGFILFCLVAFILHCLAVHPVERKNEIHRIEALWYQLKYGLPYWQNKLIVFLNSFLGHFLVYSLIFIFTISFILHFFKEGKKDLNSELKRIDEMTVCNYKQGYVNINNKSVRTEPILCGSNKCYGVDLDNKEIFTYLPENYRKPFFHEDR